MNLTLFLFELKMNFYRKKIFQNKKLPNQLFWSQELNNKEKSEIEKQSCINSSAFLINQNKKEKNMNKYKLNKNSNDNLAQNEIVQINSDFKNKKNDNIELDNEWNESKINFDNISMVSKVNSNDNNNEQSNLIDNNILFKYENFDFNNEINKENNKEENGVEQLKDKSQKNKINDNNLKSSFISNSCENYFEEKKEKEEKTDEIDNLKREKALLEEKLKKEQSINKEKSYHIEILKKALNDSVLNNAKGNKNPLNLGIVMEYSKTKLENEKLKKNIIMQQILCDDMKKEIETLKKERENLKEKNKSYEERNKILEEFEFKFNEKNNSEKQLSDELNNQKEICLNLKKEIKNLENKNEELLELNEKLNKERSIIKLEEKGIEYYEKILKEKNAQINELKLEKINFKGEQNGIIDNDIINIIKDSNRNIEDISKKIKNYFDKIEQNKIQNDIIVLKVMKDYINHINPEINGNISLSDKLKKIKEFTNIIKRNLEVLFNHFEIFQKNIFNFNRINLEANEKNIFSSSNGQNNDIVNNEIINSKKLNNDDDYLKNNNRYKKIDLYAYKNKITSKNYTENDKENIEKYNNEFLIQNSLTNSKTNILDKKRIVIKSNLSEVRKSPIVNINDNNRIKNKKIDDLFSDIFKEKLRKKKNIINLKAKELSDLMNTNSQSALKNINSFIRIPRRSNINVSEEISKINNTTNIFHTNKKIKNINDRNDVILSFHNTSRKALDYNKEKDEKHLYGINLKDNFKKNNYIKTTFPIILTNESNYYKKNLSLTNTYINKRENNTLENSKIIENSKKKRIGKNNKSNMSLENLQRELFNDRNNIKNDEINGLAEEIMKPSFLKGNSSLSINNKHVKKVKINSFKSIKTKK